MDWSWTDEYDEEPSADYMEYLARRASCSVLPDPKPALVFLSLPPYVSLWLQNGYSSTVPSISGGHLCTLLLNSPMVSSLFWVPEKKKKKNQKKWVFIPDFLFFFCICSVINNHVAVELTRIPGICWMK